MREDDRILAMEIINSMLAIAEERFEKDSLESFIKFKIIARELRLGDYSLGDEIVVDEIKEFANYTEGEKDE